MALLDLWTQSPEQLQDKQIQQLIAFSGAGQLRDDSECSSEFRSFLESVSSSNLITYAEQCLSHSFPDSGLALQDVVNEAGARLGAYVSHGRYRGTTNNIGFDGLWKFPNGHAIVVEVKTTDAYRIDLNVVAGYRKQLVAEDYFAEIKSSILFVVGRQDTGDLEAQIRGSRHAWDIRIISVDALMRLMTIKEEVEDPLIIQRIHSILIPREFTRLDEIADIIFSATEDIKAESLPFDEEDSEEAPRKEKTLTPVSFHDACILRIQSSLDKKLIKRTRAQYSTPDKSLVVNCAISKEHNPEQNPNYWFGFHPHQRDALKDAIKAFAAFGCGSSESLLLIPYLDFEPLLDGMWTTQKDDRMYWHVVIHKKGGSYILHLKKGQRNVDVSQYLLT